MAIVVVVVVWTACSWDGERRWETLGSMDTLNSHALFTGIGAQPTPGNLISRVAATVALRAALNNTRKTLWTDWTDSALHLTWTRWSSSQFKVATQSAVLWRNMWSYSVPASRTEINIPTNSVHFRRIGNSFCSADHRIRCGLVKPHIVRKSRLNTNQLLYTSWHAVPLINANLFKFRLL